MWKLCATESFAAKAILQDIMQKIKNFAISTVSPTTPTPIFSPPYVGGVSSTLQQNCAQ